MSPPAATTTFTASVSDYCVADRGSALDDQALDLAKLVLLDDLGCMLLGSTMPVGRIMREHVSTMSAGGDATIVGTEHTAAPALAALANGMANHAVELDGTHVTEGHPSAIISPACLAAAEHVSASGAELARAMILSYDVGTRLVKAIGGRLRALTELHWHSDLAHVIGATAGVGQLLGLDTLQLRYSFALAAHHVSMPGAFFAEPDHHTKALNCGQGAYAAVSGALLAQRGLTANPAILDDAHGVLHAWSRSPQWDEILDGLGERFAILDCNFKSYDAGYPIHAPVAAALRLMEREAIAFDDLDAVEVHLTTNSAQLVDDRAMKSISVQDMVALAMFSGRLDFDTVHAIDNAPIPEVERFRGRVTVVRDPDLDRADPDGRGAWISVTLRDGRVLREEQPYPPLHSRAGDISWAALSEKFAGLAGRVLTDRAVADTMATLASLEDLADVHELTTTVRP